MSSIKMKGILVYLLISLVVLNSCKKNNHQLLKDSINEREVIRVYKDSIYTGFYIYNSTEDEINNNDTLEIISHDKILYSTSEIGIFNNIEDIKNVKHYSYLFESDTLKFKFRFSEAGSKLMSFLIADYFTYYNKNKNRKEIIKTILKSKTDFKVIENEDGFNIKNKCIYLNDF